jgi:transporter family-2 protein
LPATSLLLAVLAVVAGSFLSIQAAINAQLSRGIGSPVLAAVVSFAAGLAALLVGSWASGASLPARGMAAGVPAYAWVAGGLLGASYLTANIFLTPRLGTAAMMSLAICGQLLAALAIDRYGLLGLAVRPVGLARLLGAAMLLGGAFLITRF